MRGDPKNLFSEDARDTLLPCIVINSKCRPLIEKLSIFSKEDLHLFLKHLSDLTRGSDKS